MKPGIRDRSVAMLRDPELQQNLHHALQHSLQRRADLVAANPRWPLLRERAAAIRDEALNTLPALQDALIARMQERGVTVHLARDAAQARSLCLGILTARGVRHVVKGKSMVSEEIALNPALEAQGIEVLEADLGELIVQLAGQAPSHITAPALHLNRRQVGRLFVEHLGIAYTEDPVELTGHARRFLRQKFLTAEAGITGGNFVVVDSGSLVLVENESNIRLATSLPPLHIAITGIEKLVPRLHDLAVLLELLPVSATGQKMPAAVSLLGGPRQTGETDGPREVHWILVDNGRMRLLSDPQLRSTLRCIRCGACLNVCPVFQRLGGHGFGSVYPGPIGVMLSRALLGDSDSAHAFACALCGACDEICPVQVPLTRGILEIRRRCQQAAGPSVESLGHAAFATLATRPRLFETLATLGRPLLAHWPSSWSGPWGGRFSDLRALPRPRGAGLRSRLRGRHK
ncbi:MAG: lactate utilization protein B [Pseudomonadota bacterium]